MSELTDTLASCLSFLAKQQGRLYSPTALAAGLPLENGRLDGSNFVEAAGRAGFLAELTSVSLKSINSHVLPAILLMKDGGAVILLRSHEKKLELIYPERENSPVYKSIDEIKSDYTGNCFYIKDIFQDKSDDIRKYIDAISGRKGWFRSVIFRFKGLYFNVFIASLIINTIGLASSLYVMNVYDRVLPNQAEATLWTLSLGVAGAYLFDFILKIIRAWFIDTAGKKSDIILSSAIFSSVLNVKLDKRPGSSGSFANVIRDFDSVREFFTSTTLTSFVDIPFISIYVAVIFLIGGPMGYVIAGAALIILLMNVILQWPLKTLINENLQEGSYKHSILIESLSGLEQIKALRAQGTMRGKWEKVTSILALNSMRTKLLTSTAMYATAFVQQMTTVILVFWGCYEVFEGNLTMGGLIACVILAGRAVAPLGQVTSMASRYQQMVLSLENIDQFMARENEGKLDKSLLSRPVLRGEITLDSVEFSYPGQKSKALDNVSLHIKQGEKVALLGKNGSGKTSLFRLILNFYEAGSGKVLLDGLDLRQIDISDLRKNISYVPQNPSLFLGSLRDNVLLGNATLSNEEFEKLLNDTALISLVQSQELGLDLPVGELGNRLSGGQRQMVALAAGLANDGNLVLMDEPTAALDKSTENHFIEKMKSRLADKTVIISTHKPNLLNLVDRIIIFDQGKIVMDGPRQEILQKLADNQKLKEED